MYATILQRVHETQATNGSWENSVSSTADSVLALLAVGEDNSFACNQKCGYMAEKVSARWVEQLFAQRPQGMLCGH